MKSKEYYICAAILLVGLLGFVAIPQRLAEQKRIDKVMYELSVERNTAVDQFNELNVLYKKQQKITAKWQALATRPNCHHH